MALMAINDHLTTINKLMTIARLLGAGDHADATVRNWAAEQLGLA